MIRWDSIPFFKRIEFDDPHYPGSGENISGVLLSNMVSLRKLTCRFSPPSGWPIIVHSPVGGAVDMDGSWGHAENSFHLYRPDREPVYLSCCAADIHFATVASPRLQYYLVSQINFSGIGVYYDWQWKGKPLPIGFHLDTRPRDRMQRWKRVDGEYIYLLD